MAVLWGSGGALGRTTSSVVAAAVLAVAVPTAAEAAPTQVPGGEPEPTVTVTPADGLVDGQTVDVEVTGLSGDLLISQCDPYLVQRDPDGTLHVSFVHCRNQVVEDVSGAATVSFGLREAYQTSYRGEEWSTRCGGVGPDCLVIAALRDASQAVATPVHFGPPRSAPGVAVAPSSGLHGGDVVQVEVTGLGAEQYFLVGQCERDIVTAPDPGAAMTAGACPSLQGGVAWQDPWTASVTIAEAWTSGPPDDVRGHRCRDEPGSCVIAAYGPASGTLATAPIDVDPGPVAVVPGDQEAGFPVHVFVSGRPGSTVRLAQCAAPAGPTVAASRCGGATAVALDDRGEAMTAFRLVDRIRAGGRHGRPVRCSAVDCVVALFDRAGRTVGSSPVTVYPADGPPVLSVDPSVGLTDGQVVVARITEFRNDEAWLAQCDASVVATGDVERGPCREPTLASGSREYDAIEASLVVTAEFTGADGSQVRCGVEPGACVVAIESGSGHVAAVPISFTPTGG